MMYRITRSGLLRLLLTGARQGRQNALPMSSVIDNSGRNSFYFTYYDYDLS